MPIENVIINFEIGKDEVTPALDNLELPPEILADFKKLTELIQSGKGTTAELIDTFKKVSSAAIKMGKSVEDAFGAGIKDALEEAGVSLEEFEKALKKANAPAITLKKELRDLKEAMARMKAEGKDTGKEFDDLRARAGKLADAINDANAEIKNAGSDTRNIDNVVGSISALAGGYAAVQGAAALFGSESDELQKTLIKVNGAMALATGIQQIANGLQKEGALIKLADVIATKSQSAAQYVYAAAVGTSTGAMKAFRIALLATGIGAIVFVLYEAAKAMGVFGDNTKETTDRAAELAKGIHDLNTELDANLAALKQSSALQAETLKQRGANEKTLHDQNINSIKQENELILAAAKEKVKLLGFEQYVRNKQDAENLLAIKKLQAESGTASKANQARLDEEVKAVQEVVDAYQKLSENNNAIALKDAQFQTQVILDAAKKRKEALDKAAKDALAQSLETDKNFILAAIERANKEIEQEQIAFDNKQEIEEQKREEIEKTKQAAIAAVAAAAQAGEEAGLKEVEDTKKAEEAKRQERIKTVNTMIELATRIGSVFSALNDLQTSKDTAMIAAQKKRIEEELKAGVITQKQAEAKQKALDKAEREARNRAAEREKKAAVFQAILAIPRAFLKGLEDGGIYLAAVYAALAAVEAGIIASKPVPRFFRGKQDRYEGPGVVADMGSEIVERDGRMFLYTKPTQTYLAATDKVYTAGKTRQIMHNTRINTTVRPAQSERFDYDRFAKAIPAAGLHVNIDKDGITEWTKGSLSRTTYMDKRYSSK